MQAHWDTTACIRHARLGCSESKERLLTRYTPLILSQVRRYASSFPTHADAYQTAVTAALHCIMTCPLDGDKPFAYYLKAFVRQALRHEHLVACRDRFYTAVSVFTAAGEDMVLPDVVDPDPLSRPEESFMLRHDGQKALLNHLTHEERYVLVRCCIEGFTETAVARRLGCSQAKVSRRLHKAKEKVRSACRFGI